MIFQTQIRKTQDKSNVGKKVLVAHKLGACWALGLHFIQCPFPNQIQFGSEKLHPKIAHDFPNQFQFGLERNKLILQHAYSKPNSDWFGKFWWPLSMSWKFQTKFSLVWKNHWLLPTPWTLNQFQFYFGNLILERGNTQTHFSGRWQWSSKFSKPIWIWFGIWVLQNHFFSFQT